MEKQKLVICTSNLLVTPHGLCRIVDDFLCQWSNNIFFKNLSEIPTCITRLPWFFFVWKTPIQLLVSSWNKSSHPIPYHHPSKLEFYIANKFIMFFLLLWTFVQSPNPKHNETNVPNRDHVHAIEIRGSHSGGEL